MTFSVDAPKTGDLHVLVTGDNDGRVHVLVGLNRVTPIRVTPSLVGYTWS
jgi:hypothetical protein